MLAKLEILDVLIDAVWEFLCLCSYSGRSCIVSYPVTYFICSVSTSTVTSVSQVSLSEDYLECVAKQQETLRPFGDVPRDMKAKVIRAFVTARSFVQGLLVSTDVVRKVSQVSVRACSTHIGVGILPLWGRKGKSP